LFASVIGIMPWQDVTRSSFCSGLKEPGTKRAHNFLFPKSSFRIRRILGHVQRFCYHSAAIRLSFFSKSTRAAMFTSDRVDFG
jgi:hypothetical protein